MGVGMEGDLCTVVVAMWDRWEMFYSASNGSPGAGITRCFYAYSVLLFCLLGPDPNPHRAPPLLDRPHESAPFPGE
jgi:hypothetical protein